MPRVGEAILKTLVSLDRRRRENGAAEPQDWESYVRWQFDSSDAMFARYPGLDWRGKTVLEVGCGTGGRAAYLAATGASRVVGIDINAAEIEVARDLVPRLYPAAAGQLELLASREDEPLELGEFDVVLLIDALEHLVSPPSVIRLCHQYTAPGGRCYMSCIGWYHAHGSHSGTVPFASVFFSDETILNVIRWKLSRPDYVPSRFDSDPPVDRWRGIYDLRHRPGEYLNKITLRQMKALTRSSIFRDARMHVLGYANPRLRFLNSLRHVPLIQEMFHSMVVLEFVK